MQINKTLVAIVVLILIFIFGLSRNGAVNTDQSSSANEIAKQSFLSASSTSNMQLISSAFSNGGSIPKEFTCEGQSVNPPLTFEGIPDNAKSLVLIMDDPDVPRNLKPDGMFDHWVVFNMEPSTRGINTGEHIGTEGSNGSGKPGYTGPCPPDREHRYFFRLYALDTKLTLRSGATKAEVLDALKGHIVAESELMGRYNKQSNASSSSSTAQ